MKNTHHVDKALPNDEWYWRKSLLISNWVIRFQVVISPVLDCPICMPAISLRLKKALIKRYPVAGSRSETQRITPAITQGLSCAQQQSSAIVSTPVCVREISWTFEIFMASSRKPVLIWVEGWGGLPWKRWWLDAHKESGTPAWIEEA